VTRRTASQVTAMVTNAAIFYLARPNATGFGYPRAVLLLLIPRPLRLKTFKREWYLSA
jgi:hypothetical protein